MRVGSGDHRYRWIDEWATVPEGENGRTHGVAVASDGRVVVFHQADPAVLVYEPDGTLADSWGSYPGAHGLALVTEGGTDYCWLTDQDSAAVHKTTLDGERVASLDPPEHAAYDDGSFVPTWVAPAGEEAWVADGYGESLVHRYDADGAHVGTIDGTAGAGRFDCPHAVWLDERGPDELYVADRGNERVQVYGADGGFERAFGSDTLTSPCSFAASGDDLVIPELYARVTIMADGEPIHLGENEAAVERDDWPNVPRDDLEPGRFNSPHDAAVDEDGNVYVVEWIVGGRITKLEPV